MRVLMLTTSRSLMDGINRHILAVAGGLVDSGTEVAVCTVEPRGALTAELESVGVKVYTLDCLHGHDWRIVLRFLKVLCDWRPDVIHEHVMAILVRVALSVAGGGIPIVRTVHVMAGAGCRDFSLRQLLVLLFRIRYAAVCFVSRGVFAALGDRFKAPILECVYNPIDARLPVDRGLLAHELDLPTGTPIVGTACRLAEIKRPEAFTQVMLGVLKRHPTAHAVIIGRGPREIEARLHRLAGDEARLHFLGERQDARLLLSGCAAVVMTSRSEGMPTMLLEALASDVPIAFWRGLGGLSDLARLHEEEMPLGVVAEPGDVEGLVNGLLAILDKHVVIPDGSLRLMAQRHFGLERVVRQLQEIYQRVS